MSVTVINPKTIPSQRNHIRRSECYSNRPKDNSVTEKSHHTTLADDADCIPQVIALWGNKLHICTRQAYYAIRWPEIRFKLWYLFWNKEYREENWNRTEDKWQDECRGSCKEWKWKEKECGLGTVYNKHENKHPIRQATLCIDKPHYAVNTPLDKPHYAVYI